MTIQEVYDIVDLLEIRCRLNPTSDAATNVMNYDQWIKDICFCVNDKETMKSIREQIRIKRVNVLEKGHVLDFSTTHIQDDCRVFNARANYG